MRLWAATTNAGKLREFAFASGGEFVIESFAVGEAPEETGSSFEENAAIKACAYSARGEGLLFAEDSGLCVDALDGAPGIYSARWAGDDAANNRKLVESMRGVPNRRARYVAAIALARGGELLETFRGEVEGDIVDEARGSGGFGYDPYFYYPPFAATFAELAPERKFEVSHRRRALDRLFEYLRQYR
jgi:XTP/dITP diphosphohydrolase